MVKKTTKKRAPKKTQALAVPVLRFEKKPAAAIVDAAENETLPFEIDPKKVEESLEKLKTQLVTWAKKGVYTKVRFKFRGKQLLPDIPLAAVAAVEGATFYWAGLLRALVFNFAGRTVFDIELVNDSAKKLQLGKEQLLSGELQRALKLFAEAERMDPQNPAVHLNLGIALKLKGQLLDAKAAFEKAARLGAEGPVAIEAQRLLQALKDSGV